MPLVLGILVLGHLIALLLLFYYKIETPSFFSFPRLEIMFGYFSTPIIATASAGLFQGDKGTSQSYIHGCFQESMLFRHRAFHWNMDVDRLCLFLCFFQYLYCVAHLLLHFCE